jgi:purine nucleosidase
MKILLDVDTGIDDALGIIYLAYAQHRGLVDIIASGTIGGNIDVEQSTRNTLKMWELSGLSVPVAKGANKPLLQPLHEAKHVHGDDGLGNTSLDDPNSKATGEHAVDQIIRLSHEYPGELTVVPFGPLTNLGIAFVRDPGLAQRLKRVVLMGGSSTYGNVTPVAEANIYNDPEAARMVFTSGMPLTMVGLNVTHQTYLLEEDLSELNKINNDHSRFAQKIIRFMMTAYTNFGYKTPLCILHDPLAGAAAIHADLVQTKACHVEVETQGQFTRGMTVVDGRDGNTNSSTTDVAIAVDAPRFVSEIKEALVWWATQNQK